MSSDPSKSARDRDPQTKAVLARFARNVRVLRAEADVRQDNLARAAGITPSHLSSLERGDRNPTISTVAKLAHAFDVEPAELLRGVPVIAPKD